MSEQPDVPASDSGDSDPSDPSRALPRKKTLREFMASRGGQVIFWILNISFLFPLFAALYSTILSGVVAGVSYLFRFPYYEWLARTIFVVSLCLGLWSIIVLGRRVNRIYRPPSD